jgi:phage shock protein PspC (stress-responsive transcriptional regulator)
VQLWEDLNLESSCNGYVSGIAEKLEFRLLVVKVLFILCVWLRAGYFAG